MKPDKFRELYARIDTDISMDHRIKNRLLYYDNIKESDARKSYGEGYDRSKHGSAVTRFRKLKPILPSLGVLIFIAIILIGTRANLFSKTPEHETAASNGQSPDDSDLSSLLDRLLGDAAEGNDESVNMDKAQGEDPIITEDINGPEKGSEANPLPNDPDDGSPAENADGSEGETMTPPEGKPETNQEAAPAVDTKTEKAVPATGDFYFAHFDVLTVGSVKASIPSLVIRLHGTVDSINPADLTDIVLTRDGVLVDNSIISDYRKEQFTWGYEEVTDFYFDFASANTEPGFYDLVGNYKGLSFSVYSKILETTLTEEPADKEDLSSVGWVYQPDKNDQPMIISELVFNFEGLQNAFYVTDLTDLKVTVNGNEIPIAFEERVFRYYEANDNNTGDTSFNLILKEPFIAAGTYKVTGNYRGLPFTSMELTIRKK